MTSLLTKVLGDKQEWKAMEARAKALPRDYRIVYGVMTSYMFTFATGDGMDIVAALWEVLCLVEDGAAQGRGVLDITGEDVAAFCHENRRGTTSYLDMWRTALNRDIAAKIAQ